MNGRTMLKYSFGAIALYIIVARGTSSGNVIRQATSGATNLVRAFQGR